MSQTDSESRPRRWFPAAWRPDTKHWVLLVLLLVLAVVLWRASHVLLIFFGAVLVALFLNGLSSWIERHSRLSKAWAMTLVLVSLAAVATLGVWLLAGPIERHLVRLASELPKALTELEERLRNSMLGRELIRAMPNTGGIISTLSTQVGAATGMLFTVLVDILVLFFVGLYLAINPDRYLGAIFRLFPAERRHRLQEVADVLGVTLQRWIIGRLILMTSNAVVTALGLWLLGMRLPVTLGIVSGLLNFVPNLGPIIAAVPAILLAFVEGPMMALYVALFYLGYQMLDGYVLTPLVQRQSVALPPALTIMSQVLMGVLFGTVGVLFAVPLVATALVTTKMLYLHDVLGEKVEVPKTQRPPVANHQRPSD